MRAIIIRYDLSIPELQGEMQYSLLPASLKTKYQMFILFRVSHKISIIKSRNQKREREKKESPYKKDKRKEIKANYLQS